MDWSKAKSILILFMLAANIFLGANILMLFCDSRTEEEEAVRSACAISAEQGAQIPAEVVMELPDIMKEYVFSRDINAESDSAKKLLGSFSEERPGGGIYSYISDTGAVTFRSGGYTELEFFEEESHDIEKFLTPDKNSALEAVSTDEGFELCLSGIPVSGASFVKNEKGYSGNWIFGRLTSSERQSMSRHAMVLAAGRAVKAEHMEKVECVEAAYVMTPMPSGDIRLTPAWKVACGSDAFYISALSGEVITM